MTSRYPKPFVSPHARAFERSLSVVLAVGLATSAGSAQAASPAPQPSPTRQDAPEATDAERLRDLFARGQAAFDAGSYRSAVEAFEEAFELSNDPTLLFNISVCYDRLGEYGTALEYLDRYERLSDEADADEVERRRASLELRAERAERDAQQTTTDGEASASEPADDRAQSETVAAPAVSQGPAANVPEPLMTPASWTLLGVGLVGLATGVGLGVASFSAGNRADCENARGAMLCTESGADDARSSRNLGLGADVAFGIGGAASVAVIAILAVRARKRNRRRDVAWSPSVGPDFGGAVLRGRF